MKTFSFITTIKNDILMEYVTSKTYIRTKEIFNLLKHIFDFSLVISDSSGDKKYLLNNAYLLYYKLNMNMFSPYIKYRVLETDSLSFVLYFLKSKGETRLDFNVELEIQEEKCNVIVYENNDSLSFNVIDEILEINKFDLYEKLIKSIVSANVAFENKIRFLEEQCVITNKEAMHIRMQLKEFFILKKSGSDFIEYESYYGFNKILKLKEKFTFNRNNVNIAENNIEKKFFNQAEEELLEDFYYQGVLKTKYKKIDELKIEEINILKEYLYIPRIIINENDYIVGIKIMARRNHLKELGIMLEDEFLDKKELLKEFKDVNEYMTNKNLSRGIFNE